MLLVDKVIEMGEGYIVGVKNVTTNEPFFTGHFPQEPVMPGVLMVEAMAQTGGLLVLSCVDDPERYSTYFMKIDNVKFRLKSSGRHTHFPRFVHDTLAPRLRHNERLCLVGETIVCECEFMAQVIKNK